MLLMLVHPDTIMSAKILILINNYDKLYYDKLYYHINDKIIINYIYKVIYQNESNRIINTRIIR